MEFTPEIKALIFKTVSQAMSQVNLFEIWKQVQLERRASYESKLHTGEAFKSIKSSCKIVR